VAILSSGSQAADLMTFLPNTISPELVHQSHTTQHFGADQSTYGSNAFALDAHWDLPRGFVLDLSEALAFGHRTDYPGYANGASTMYSYGEILGPREQFTARVGYRFRVH
jgi:hypothetical protein